MSSKIIARSMATAATQAVKPPVQLFGLEGTYASALYTAAAKTSSVENASKSLNSILQTISKDKKTESILASPALSLDERLVVAKTLAEATKVDASVSNLLKVLAENNRLSLFESISNNFKILTDAHQGIVEAVVTSATKLDSKILKKIEAAVSKSKFVGQGKTLRLSNTVNPDILGGLIVEVGDRTVDASIASKVAKLNQALKESI